MMASNDDWKRFARGTTPSTVSIDPLFFEAVEQGAHVLDIGCGRGTTAHRLDELGYAVTGVDINTEEVEYARETYGSQTARFLEGDATKLPFEDKTFDACIMQALLTTIAEPAARTRAIEEAHRVLVDSGILYLGVFACTPENPAYKRRYDAHAPLTGEKGTFFVTRNGSDESERLYRAHHYTRYEVESLLDGLFSIGRFVETAFRSYHGNRCNAFVVIAHKI
jgi:ubiquinone/menaquinone biosynthesis C-methylase UbiE